MSWSLLLNIVLLIGVLIAILRTVKMRRQEAHAEQASKQQQPQPTFDEVVAVRRLNQTEPLAASRPAWTTPTMTPRLTPQQITPETEQQEERAQQFTSIAEASVDEATSSPEPVEANDNRETQPLMMFLLAKPNRQLAGYELLQAILASGFRFGEGDLFHRYQYPNGQGAVMCSLAAATPSGVFDMQNMGGFMVRGLCLYMHMSGNTAIDAERFDVMLDTAKSLSDALDTLLLDDERAPLSEASIQRYYQHLSINGAH